MLAVHCHQGTGFLPSVDRLELMSEECDPQTTPQMPLRDNVLSHLDSAKGGSHLNVVLERLGRAAVLFLAGVRFPESPTFMGVSHKRDC